MIKAEELRIGNIIKASTGEIIVCKAINIYEIETGLYQAEPIPTDEDILIASGFEHRSSHRGEGQIFDFKDDDYTVLIWREYEKNGGGYRTSHLMGKCRVDYVHELQNIFYALYKTEIKIVLDEKKTTS